MLSRVSNDNRLNEALQTIERHSKEIVTMKDKIYIDYDKATAKTIQTDVQISKL